MSLSTKRTPEGWRKLRERSITYKRKRRLDPAYLEKEAQQGKVRYQANRDRLRKQQREYRERNKEKINARRREWRKENPGLAKEYDSRCRKSGFKHTLARVRDGTMGLDELNQRLNKSLVRLNERIKPKGSE